MSILGPVATLFREERQVVYECRRCGTSLDADASACPACGRDDIARYEVA